MLGQNSFRVIVVPHLRSSPRLVVKQPTKTWNYSHENSQAPKVKYEVENRKLEKKDSTK